MTRWFHTLIKAWAHILLAAMLLVSLPVHADSPPPRYFQLPAGMPNHIVLTEEYGEVDFPIGKPPQENLQRGRRWSGETSVPDVTYDDPPGTAWKRMESAFTKNGWAVKMLTMADATLYYRRGDVEAWAKISFGDPQDCRYDLIELARQARTLKLTPPAPVPESFKANDDIPYLKPLPDFKLVSGGMEDGTFTVPLAGADEAQFIAPRFHHRLYGGNEVQVSEVQFVSLYESALKAAGWQIVNRFRGGLYAHYTANGRDIWARLHAGSGDINFQIADLGADNLAAKLKKECRATLSGVFFDFDQASLKPESQTALARARVALQANANLAFEVQGHTDNKGKDDYNLRLSQARAASVMNWLTSHGIAATQLTAQGYGKTKPVAPNDTDEGRARNRRVELVCRK